MPHDRAIAARGRSLIGGGSAVLAVKIAAAAISFGLALAIPRAFGRDATGVFFLSLTVVVVASTVAALGLDRAIVRFVSVGAGRADWPTVEAVYRRSVAASGTAAVAVGAVLWLAAPWVATRLFGDPEVGPVLRILAVATPAATLLLVHAAALRSLRRPVAADAIAVVAVPLGVLLYVAAAGSSVGISSAAVAYVAVSFAALAAAAVWWRRSAPRPERGGDANLRRMLATAGPLLVVTSMGLVVTWTDILMVGVFESVGEVAVYVVASRTARVLATSLAAGNAILEPRFALLYSEGRLDEIGVLARRAAAILAAVTLPGVLVLTVFRDQVLGLFGEGFESGAAVLVILTLAQLVNVGAGAVGPILAMTGNEKPFQYAAMGAAAVNVALNVLLIPTFGIEGAAVATASTVVAMNAVAVWLIYRRLGVTAIPLLRLPARR